MFRARNELFVIVVTADCAHEHIYCARLENVSATIKPSPELYDERADLPKLPY